MFQIHCLACFLLLSPASSTLLSPALAADEREPLITDRPDQTESAVTVPAGSWQIETGISLGRDDEEGLESEELNVAATLMRVGLTEILELRLGWEGYFETSAAHDADAHGVGDANLGFKIALREGEGLSPTAALIATTTVPVGEAPFSSEAWDPSLRLSVSHDLSETVGVGWNLGIARETIENGTARELATVVFFTATVAFDLSERLGLYLEAFGDTEWDDTNDPNLLFDAGLTYLVHDLLQLDCAAGVGLTDTSLDYFVSAGMSIRFGG